MSDTNAWTRERVISELRDILRVKPWHQYTVRVCRDGAEAALKYLEEPVTHQMFPEKLTEEQVARWFEIYRKDATRYSVDYPVHIGTYSVYSHIYASLLKMLTEPPKPKTKVITRWLVMWTNSAGHPYSVVRNTEEGAEKRAQICRDAGRQNVRIIPFQQEVSETWNPWEWRKRHG